MPLLLLFLITDPDKSSNGSDESSEEEYDDSSESGGSYHLPTTDSLMKTITPMDSHLYRCLSKREGCHVLDPYLDTKDTSQTHELPLCTPSMLTLIKNCHGSPIEQLESELLRVGLIDLQHHQKTNEDVDVKVKRVGEEDVKVGLIVLRGKYQAFKSDKSETLNRQSKFSFISLEGLKEKRFSCMTTRSCILVVYVFKAALFDYIRSMSPPIHLKEVFEGFSSSGLEVTIDRSENMPCIRMLPVYPKHTSETTTRGRSLWQALTTFLGEKTNSLNEDDITKMGEEGAIAAIEKKIKRCPALENFRLVVIENTAEGLKLFNGSRESLLAKKNRKPCVLYLHDICCPTIPSFDSHAPKIFVLLKESKEPSMTTQAWQGMTYPPEMHPYKNTPLRATQQVSPPTYTFPSPNAAENRLKLNESQRKYAPMLSGLEDVEKAKLLAETRDCINIDVKQATTMKNNEYLNDQHVDLLISM